MWNLGKGIVAQRQGPIGGTYSDSIECVIHRRAALLAVYCGC